MLEYADADTVRDALKTFWAGFPDHDPQDLATRFQIAGRFQLPEPFEWVEIPAGEVEIDGFGTFSVAPFAMGKYPITVAQFARFVDDSGYFEKSYWTSPGWEWLEKEQVTMPAHWHDTRFHKADYPIVGVSWYEALAYCRWLSEKVDRTITLPTEQQWQWAAQGETKLLYPWGNAFDARRCNGSIGNRSTSTTAVNEFEAHSPFGVADLSGNVWEWTLTEFSNAHNNELDEARHRVLRGGSWASDIADRFKTTHRGRYGPYGRSYDYGFRVVRLDK